jgi:hypothetical protein
MWNRQRQVAEAAEILRDAEEADAGGYAARVEEDLDPVAAE